MNAITITLFGLGAAFVVLAHIWFIKNTKYDHYDSMGASINFDQPFAIGALLISIGVGTGGWLEWYYCIALFIAIELVSNIYKWKILDRLLVGYRKPNPKN